MNRWLNIRYLFLATFVACCPVYGEIEVKRDEADRTGDGIVDFSIERFYRDGNMIMTRTERRDENEIVIIFYSGSRPVLVEVHEGDDWKMILPGEGRMEAFRRRGSDQIQPMSRAEIDRISEDIEMLIR